MRRVGGFAVFVIVVAASLWEWWTERPRREVVVVLPAWIPVSPPGFPRVRTDDDG